MRSYIAVLSIYLVSSAALAHTGDIVTQHLPEAKVVGEGKLSYWMWDVYNATLYAPRGNFQPEKPFALSIHYLREIDGNVIADKSVQEIRNQGFADEVMLAAWNAQMKHMFPNVTNGSSLTAVFVPGKQTQFYADGRPIGIIRGAEFTRRFSDIWLSENTSQPGLRRQLLTRHD